MAVSGNFGTSNQYIVYYIEGIQNSQDVTNNLSNVTVRVWVKRTNTGYTTYGTGSVSVNINGGAYSASITTAQKITNTPIILFERNLNVGHNADGTGTLSVSASISHSVFSSGTNSWSMGLTTIPRATQPTLSSTNFNMGSAITINTPRASGSFTHTLVCTFGGYQANIAFDVATSFSWTPPTASLAPQIPNATSGLGSITCHTYNGGTLIGSKSVNFTANIPTSVVPTFNTITHVETEQVVIDKAIGAYVQNMSKPRFTCTSPAGVYGSTIARHEFIIEGISYNAYSGPSVTMGVVNGSGTVAVSCTIYDSRGRTATKSVNMTVLAYAPPAITSFSVQRCNSDGTLNDMGTYAKVTRGGTFSTLSAKNTLTIKVKSKLRGAGTWTDKHTSAILTTSPQSGSVTLSTYSATTSHDFMVEFTDLFNTTLSLLVLPTGEVTMSWGPAGIGIGKVWESGALDVKGTVNIEGNLGLGSGQMYGRFGSERIPAGADLNNYTTEGIYYTPLSADAVTMANRVSGVAFSMVVEQHAGTKQTVTEYMSSGWAMYVRNRYQTTWGPWIPIMKAEKPGFVGVTLLNGWVNLYASQPTGYYITQDGLVVVTGRIGNGNTTGGIQLCSLPAPQYAQYFSGRGCRLYLNQVGTCALYADNNSDIGFDSFVYRMA